MTELAGVATPEPRRPDPRYVLRYGSVRDGRLYGPLPASAGSGSLGLRGEGTFSATLPGNDRAAQIYRALPPGKGLWALEWNNGQSRRIVDAGTMWNRTLPEDSLPLTGAGIFALLSTRLLIPNVDPTLVAVNSLTYSNLDQGSIMRALVAQVLSMPNGDLPINLEAPRAGIRTQTYYGYDMAMAGQRITELADQDPNTDFVFLPRFATGSTTAVQWDMLTGTETVPKLTNVVPWRLNRTTPGQKVVGSIEVADTATGMATVAWAAGGGSEKNRMIRAASDSTLTGWPRLDVVTTNNSTSAVDGQRYANGALAQLSRPARSVKVQVSATWWWGTGGRVGDKVHLTADHRIAGRIDVTSRILSVAWDLASPWVGLTLADTLAEEGV